MHDLDYFIVALDVREYVSNARSRLERAKIICLYPLFFMLLENHQKSNSWILKKKSMLFELKYISTFQFARTGGSEEN